MPGCRSGSGIGSTLTNVTGSYLSNCTVLVEIHSKDGDTRQNVHFIDSWAPGETLYARYGIGYQSDAGVYGRQTVYGVQRIILSAWSDQGRDEAFKYDYIGAERDADITELLTDRLLVKYRYVEKGFWDNFAPRVLLYLHGIPSIPSHRITLSMYEANGESPTSSWAWDRGDWYEGQEAACDLTGNLTFRPSKMDIWVTFPDSQYRYRRTVDITAP